MNGTTTVLVVDDEPLVRWSVAETLVDSGYAVTQAGDALQALESVKAAPAVIGCRLAATRDVPGHGALPSPVLR